jgi:3-methyladenine DNA glycosylase AlkC
MQPCRLLLGISGSLKDQSLGNFRGALALAAMIGGVALVGVSAAQTPAGPANSASISYPPNELAGPGSNTLVLPNGNGAVTISWSADCDPPANDPDPDEWSWSVTVGGQYSNGSGAFDTGYISPNVGETSWSDQRTFGVALGPQEKSDTVSWEAQLHCGSDPSVETIGSGSFTIERCNSDDYNTAQREYEAAEKLLDTGAEELKKAIEVDEPLEQENKDELAKTTVLESFVTTVLDGLEHGEVVGKTAALEVEAAFLAYDLLGLYEEASLKTQDLDRLTNGAAADFAHADSLSDDANQRLGRAFAGDCQDPIHDQVKKLTDEQKLDDEAHAIIDKWMHNETLYVNPLTGEAEQVDYALKQVKAQLSGGHNASDMTARDARAKSHPKVTVAEARAAIRFLHTARKLLRTIRGQLAHIDAADEEAIKALSALLG